MKASTAIVALHGERTGLVLHGEVAPDSARPIANEVVRLCETTALDEVVEEVVQCFLSKSEMLLLT